MILSYGIVMPTMFDSEVFRASLKSLLASDFQGQVVVVEEGNQPTQSCDEFCERIAVNYVKNPTWTGPAGGMNLGIRAFHPPPDILLYAHNDLLWPPRWWGALDKAWQSVYASNKVEVLNLPAFQFHHRLTPTLQKFFLAQNYYRLLVELGLLTYHPRKSWGVQSIQLRDPIRQLGIAPDVTNERPDLAQRMDGRFSFASSFPYSVWDKMGGFTEAIAFAPDAELFQDAIRHHRWMLWANTPPVIHFRASDTRRLLPDDREKFNALDRQSYTAFQEKYGWHLDHVIYTFFAEISVIYHDDIVEAANTGRWGDIDHIFTEYEKRLSSKRLADCEIMFCASRKTCAYA